MRVALVALALLTALPAAGQDRSFLWQIEDADSRVYLLGSFHLLRPEVYPLDAAIDAAYADAEVLAFELDLDETQAAGMKMMQAGMLPDSLTLADVVSPDLHARLDSTASRLGLPMPLVAKMRPWMASMMVTVTALQRGGYDVASGIDAHFHARAEADGKARVAFETVEQQLDLFARGDGDAMLREALDELERTPVLLDTLTRAWQHGDVAAFERLVLDEMADQPEFRQAMLDDRNEAWIPQIEALLAREGEDALVVVGAGHLVGERGVVALLERAGYRVTQL